MLPKPNPKFDDLIKEIAPLSPDNYYDFVFHYDEAHYQLRVDMTCFKGAERVLDVGCGYGQWAVALAQVNKNVIGVDINPKMVEISKIVSGKYKINNATFDTGKLPSLDFPDASFDLIWCWGVLMFVDRTAALKEFYRLLKPGGRFLAGCVNGRGRWVHKLLTSVNVRRFNPQLFEISLATLLRGGSASASPNFTTLQQAGNICKSAGFKLIAAGLDGHIDLTGQKRELPMFPPYVYGLENNIEFVAEKQ